MHLAWSWAVAANQRRFRNSCCWCSQELQLEEGWKTRCGGIKLKCGRAHRLSHSRWWKVIKVKDVFMYKKVLTNLFVTTCYAEQQEKQTQIQKQARKIKDEKKSAEMSNTRKDKTSRRRFRQLTDPSHLSFFVMLQKINVGKTKDVCYRENPQRMKKIQHILRINSTNVYKRLMLCCHILSIKLFGVQSQCKEKNRLNRKRTWPNSRANATLIKLKIKDKISTI